MDVNTMDCSETENIRVKMEAVLDFRVGGESHEDRLDSLAEMFENHTEDITEGTLLGRSITAMTTEFVGGLTTCEALSKMMDILDSNMKPDEMVARMQAIVCTLKGCKMSQEFIKHLASFDNQ